MKNHRTTNGFVSIGLLAVLVLLGPASLAEEKKKAGYLSPPDLFKLAEDSDQNYTVSMIDELEGIEPTEFASLLWPEIGNGPEYPVRHKEQSGSITLAEYELDPACQDLLLDAEAFFKDENYVEALKLYMKAVEQYPDCYVAYANLGDCFFFQDNFDEALSLYDKSIELNPDDFRGHFFRANTLYRLGRYAEAREAYLRALALRPHRESVIQNARAYSGKLGIQVVDQPFEPRTFVRQEEGEIGIYIDEEAPYWIAYAMCKGIWLGEANHREERTGSPEHQWTLTEERQCLLSMSESYLALREDNSVGPDPDLERIVEVIHTGALDGFVLYEIAYRLHPNASLLLPDNVFNEILSYVDEHVLVRSSPAEKAGSKNE